MRAFLRLAGPLVVLLSALFLTACDTPKQRAETYYQRGLALAAAGETDRALVELRNVFRLDPDHVPARLEYADLLRARGETREAYGQYLRLVDLDPKNLAGQRALAEMALQAQDFPTAEAAAAAAYGLAPADPGIRALKATVDFRHDKTRAAALDMARGVLAEQPDNVAAHMVLIADRIDAGAPREAMPLIETALLEAPKDEGLHLVRLAALEQIGDTAATGDELRAMRGLFPEDQGVLQALVQWYLRTGDKTGAEAALRAEAGRRPGDPQPALALVQFLIETGAPGAAEAELDARIDAALAAGQDPRPFQRARAGLDFTQGRTDQAIAALRALLAAAPPSPASTAEAEVTRALQVALAQMLAETGATAEAQALIAAVLAGDAGNIEALKLRAKMAIDADQPAQAIQDMRSAASAAPDDPEIKTILALAHEREGSRELAGQQLALAVEVSHQAPEESLRYARFLMQDGRVGPAEGVVTDALRQAPDDPDLLMMLGRLHLERQDWARVAQVAGILRGLGSPEAAAMATELATDSLRGQGRMQDALAALQGLAATGDPGAEMALVQGALEAGDLAAAQASLDTLRARDPGAPAGRLMQAALDQIRGDPGAAEALYRGVLADAPALPQAHRAYAAFLAGQGRAAEALATLGQGLAAAPGNGALLFAQAGILEATGDIDGAIAAYEALYAQDSSAPVVANNLASLLASWRDDPASLERAFTIARRLRASDMPFFQDTYGWILHRRGDDVQALTYLAPAAQALPDNALVQFHLAEAQAALGRTEAARAAYLQALAAAEAGSPLPQADAARQKLAAFGQPPAAPPPSAATTPAAP